MEQNISQDDIGTLVRESGISTTEQEGVKKMIHQLLTGEFQGNICNGIQTTENLRRFRGLFMEVPDYVGVHQQRINMMTSFSQHLLVISFPEFDMRKAQFMGRFHDGSEGISPLGDIPTLLKESLSPRSCMLLDLIERKCVESLANATFVDFYGEGNKVRSMLLEVHEKSSIESWIVKWFDLVDAFMVTIREVESGNGETFLPIYEQYLERFRAIQLGKRYPDIKGLLDALKFKEWDIHLCDLFDREDGEEQSNSLEYFRTSKHLFDIGELTQDIRMPDGTYNFPEAYTVWRKHIDKAGYNLPLVVDSF